MKKLFAQHIDETTLIKVVKEIINQENIFFTGKKPPLRLLGKLAGVFCKLECVNQFSNVSVKNIL